MDIVMDGALPRLDAARGHEHPGDARTVTWNFSEETRSRLDNIAKLLGNAVFTSDFYRCQSLSIAAMLRAGIRFFDLRYALDATDTFLTFWHGAALTSETSTVGDYMGGTKKDASDNAEARRQIVQILTSPAARRYMVQTRDELGSLGEARGKVVLFRRFDVEPGDRDRLPGMHLAPALWPDNGQGFELVYNAPKNLSAFVGDYYGPNDLPAPMLARDAIARKLAVTTAHLDKAASAEHTGSLFVTFASAEFVLNQPPLFPSTMALGNGTDSTSAGGVNHQLLSFLQSGPKGRRLGIVVLDFFHEPTGLVEAILDHGARNHGLIG